MSPSLRNLLIAIPLLFLVAGQAKAQDDLLDLLDEQTAEEEQQTTEFTYATFKTTRVINGRSIETPAKGELQFVIAHRFGRINDGWRELFGLDQSNIRFGFEYGATDWLSIGFGRSSVEKTYDGFFKLKILRQSTGKVKMPVTVALFSNIAVVTYEWPDTSRVNYFTSRLSYTYQLMIARKFNRNFSAQLTPTMVHRNLVDSIADQNDVFAIGAGIRYLFTGSISLNLEYFYLLPGKTADDFEDAASIGLDIETGGHVFQIMLSNSLGMTESLFVPRTDGKWENGDIHLGFNINRIFTIVDYDRIKQKKAAKKL